MIKTASQDDVNAMGEVMMRGETPERCGADTVERVLDMADHLARTISNARYGNTPQISIDSAVNAYNTARESLSAIPQQRVLSQHQPCGCQVCICENDDQCQGCGAKSCGKHENGSIPNPVYATPQQEVSVQDCIDFLSSKRMGVAANALRALSEKPHE